MIGWACYLNSSEFLNLDNLLFEESDSNVKSRWEILVKYSKFVDYIWEQEKNVKLVTLLKPISTLYSGVKGNKKFKQLLQSRLEDDQSFELHVVTNYSFLKKL